MTSSHSVALGGDVHFPGKHCSMKLTGRLNLQFTSQCFLSVFQTLVNLIHFNFHFECIPLYVFHILFLSGHEGSHENVEVTTCKIIIIKEFLFRCFLKL